MRRGGGASLSKRRNRKLGSPFWFLGQKAWPFLDDKERNQSNLAYYGLAFGLLPESELAESRAGGQVAFVPWGTGERGAGSGWAGAGLAGGRVGWWPCGLVKLELCLGLWGRGRPPAPFGAGCLGSRGARTSSAGRLISQGMHPSVEEMPINIRNNIHHLATGCDMPSCPVAQLSKALIRDVCVMSCAVRACVHTGARVRTTTIPPTRPQ